MKHYLRPTLLSTLASCALLMAAPASAQSVVVDPGSIAADVGVRQQTWVGGQNGAIRAEIRGPQINQGSSVSARVHNDEDIRARTQYNNAEYNNSGRAQVRSSAAVQVRGDADAYGQPQDISPAAGRVIGTTQGIIRGNVPPSARVMGGIQGGVSYND